MRGNARRLFFGLVVVLMLVGIIGATDFTKTDVNGGYYRASLKFKAYEFTLTPGSDTTIAGKEPAIGTLLVDEKPANWTRLYYYDDGISGWDETKDSIWQDDGKVYYDSGRDTLLNGSAFEDKSGNTTNPWTTIYFYDNGDSTWENNSDCIWEEKGGNATQFDEGTDVPLAGKCTTGLNGNTTNPWSFVYFYDNNDNTWNISEDMIWLDDGKVYYDDSLDICIAGNCDEAQEGSLTEPAGWDFSYYDANSVDYYDNSTDWIGIDEDNNGVFKDIFKALILTNKGNATADDMNLSLFAGSDCSGTLLGSLVPSGNQWEINLTALSNEQPLSSSQDYVICVNVKDNASSNRVVRLSIDANNLYLAGESLPLVNEENLNSQIIDTLAPTTVDNIPASWQNSTFTVVLTCNDDVLCDKVYYTTDGSDPTTGSSYVNATNSWSFNISNEGIYTIKYFGVDKAGNVESIKTASNTLKIDLTAPIISNVHTLPNSPTNIKNITISFDVNDSLSDVNVSSVKVSTTNYSVNAECTLDNLTSIYHCSAVFSGLNDGTYDFVISSEDLAGNVGTYVINNYVVDTTAPFAAIDVIAKDYIVVKTEMESLSVKVVNIMDNNLSSNVTLNLTIVPSENLTHVLYKDDVIVALNGSAKNYTFNGINVSSWNDGIYYVDVILVDSLGNYESIESAFFKFTANMSEITNGLLIDSQSTQLNEQDDWDSIANITFATSFGKVTFIGETNLSDEDTVEALERLYQYFMMNGTRVSLDALGALSALNKSARIIVYDYEDYGITTPVIYMNGAVCKSDVCADIDTTKSDLGGNDSKRDITFTVQHWTTYEVRQASEDESNVKIDYVYVKDNDYDGKADEIYVVFSGPINLTSNATADEIFELNTNEDTDASFGVTETKVYLVSSNVVKIILGKDPNIDYRKLYGFDEEATALRVKEGQTKLVKAGTIIPVSSGNFEDIATGAIEVNNGVVFSVPYCVDMNKIKAKIGSVHGIFEMYVNGSWKEADEFKPLYGYKYFGNSSFVMPIYTYEQGCDVVPNTMKIRVNNDWNLLGLDDIKKRYAADWLASLTLRSSVETFIEQLVDENGHVLADYSESNYTFDCNQVEPFKAYWIWYNGNDGHMFNGFENDETTDVCGTIGP